PWRGISLSLPSRLGTGERRHLAARGRRFRRFGRLGRRPRLVDLQIGGDPVDLVHELAARLVVVNLDGLRGSLVAIEPVEHLHERRDRRDVALGDRFAGEPHRRLKAGQLQFGVLRAFVDDAPRERLPDDLAHALGREALLACDLVIVPALAEPRENAPPPQDPPMRVEPARERRRPVVDHACLAWPPAWRPLLTERSIIAWIWKCRKQNLRIFALAALGPEEHLLAAARYVAENPV